MKTIRLAQTYKGLREKSLWRLLAAHDAPSIVAILQVHFMGDEKSIPASALHERVERDLEVLRSVGEDFSKTAQQYVMDWVRSGYLERRFPEGSNEEQYQLSASTVSAIRFISNVVEPRSAATESRLSTVIHELIRLAEESDPNPESRIKSLEQERDKINREIEAIQKGEVKSIPEDRALERIREVVTLADELTADFRHVRERFDGLNRDLREKLLNHEGNRGEVLEQLFSGVDVISESDEGRTFAAFWRHLTDPDQSFLLETSIDQILTRPFSAKIPVTQRRFLLRMTRNLLNEGTDVHKTLQYFARSLKHFVQSQEYLEHRRLTHLIRQAQQQAIQLKDTVPGHSPVGYTLQLTTSRLSSYSQWSLYDPSLHTVSDEMREGEGAPFDLNSISSWVALSEIDFRALKKNIVELLSETSQASIGELLCRFPAKQGLGSLVGYLTLGDKHGVKVEGKELVTWRGMDSVDRSAYIPTIHFLREKIHEL